jgi:hypothetical protein
MNRHQDHGPVRQLHRRTGTTAALGADSGITVMMTPEIDTFRYPNLWNTDIRAIFDVFHVMNANTALVRVKDVTSPTFNAPAQNLSPRIARVGLVVGF